jgi:uncharacterized protein (UPF0333 family)
MSLLSPIFWLGGMLAAIVGFFVAMLMENSQRKRAAQAAQARNAAMVERAEPSPDFPSENLDFPE